MGKNIQRVRDMIDGSYHRKTVVSVNMGEPRKKREVGERWTDIHGVEWEQKKGYYSKITKLEPKGIADSCTECGQYIFKGIDKATYKRMQRCYYCQIDFEARLKSLGKWDDWVMEQETIRYEAIQADIKQYYKENNETSRLAFDDKLANAITNVGGSMKVRKDLG